MNVSCPLHKDIKPSLRIYAPATRGGYCFSCGKAYTSASMHQALTQCSHAELKAYFEAHFSLNLSHATHTPTKQVNHAKIAKIVAPLAYNHITAQPDITKRLNNFIKLESYIFNKFLK